ncbi:hypothetical protein BWG23_03010 [Flavobacterium oreochromis]|nr:hypothetical protein BWG23_03010 [Flavobacterium oreochromis]
MATQELRTRRVIVKHRKYKESNFIWLRIIHELIPVILSMCKLIFLFKKVKYNAIIVLMPFAIK